MNDPQAWALIAGFFALMVTMISLTLRTVRTDVQAAVTHLMDG